MDKGKVKPLGGAKRASGNKQQGNGAELDDEWQVVQEEELQARGSPQATAPDERKEMAHLRSELMAGSGPACTLSTDSEPYRTPLTSLSEQDRGEHRGLVQIGASDSGVIMRLQEESIAKDTTIRKLHQEVNHLQQRLKYTEQLEEQNLRLTTEERKHEQEKQMLRAEIQQLQRRVSVSRRFTRGYAHEQKLQELVKRYERQYNEQLEENSMLQEKISQLEKEMHEDTVVSHIDEVGDSDLKVELKTQVESLQQHSMSQSRQILQLKQELEALKAAGEEVDKSWRDMVDELEFPPHEPKVETGKDLKARVDRYRQERDKARSEVRALQKQLEQSVGEAERGGSLTAQYEKRIQQLETVVADTNRKHEEHVEKLTKELENVLSQHAQTGSMTDSSLEEDSRCPSNRIFCQPSSADSVSKVVIEGRRQGSIKLEDVQRALSKEPIEVSRAELASLGARERRSVQKKIQQLQIEVDLKNNEIETLSNQLEQRGQRIEALSKVLEQTQQTTKRGLRHTNEDSYLKNITKMTEQLSAYEISDRAQNNELVKLRAKVKEAETVTEQLDGYIQQMEELEMENRMLTEQIARQGGGGAGEQQHGREVTYQSYNQEMMAELSRLRPFEQEVQRLQKELEKAKSFRKDAIFYHSRVITLTTKLSEVEEENRRVRAEYHDLEGSYKVLENEINSLRAQLQTKEPQVGQIVSDRMQRAGGGAAESAEEVSQLKRRLDLKEREILKLKSQSTELASSMKPNPRARLKDAAMGQSTDEPPLDLPTDMVELQQLLREKDAHIAIISQQLQMFEKTAADLTKIVQHTKRQSEIVKNLKHQLARAEGELKKKDNLIAAKDSVQDELERLQKSCAGKEIALIATRQKNDSLKKEIEQLSGTNAQLDFQLRQVEQRSIAALSQKQKAAAQLDEAVKERNHWEQKTIAQQAKIERQLQELAQSRRDVTQLTTEAEHLRKDKADLLGEVEAHRVMVETFAKETEEWRSACDGERCRREALERRIAELEKVNDLLRQDNSYEFWNIPRSEVYPNMQKFLGTGAWGFVVEGTFRGQRVAVKCLHDMIRSPKSAEVMRKEIAIMAQVRHPNLVLLIAAVMDAKNSPLIITELLDISLRKAYEEKLLQGSSKLNIFRDIAAALNYLHLHHGGEIIHRDVSSANVLMEAKPNNQWKAKLSDFGSAKLAIEAKSTAPGAPVYSAPEVRKEMRIPQTAKLDVYSYGILLCEVTVEQFPDEESLPSMMQEVQGKWAFMHHLITSCVQNHPDNRPTMSYILTEFNKLSPQN